METKIIFYGGQEIKFPEILEEIKTVENLTSEDTNCDLIDTSGSFVCKFIDHKINITLGERVTDGGGEGVVYKTSREGMVAKLYYPKLRTAVRERKINLMVNYPIIDKRICWPVATLYSNGKFVGLLMPIAKGETIDIDNGHRELSDFFKQDRRNLLRMLINVMSIFEVLQEHQIIMGDVNFGNFIINPFTFDVTLIDLDGAQIDKYPCIGCKECFNAPELFKNVIDEDENEEHVANKTYHKIYSSYSRDCFSLAAYAFMMMMCVKPYANKRERPIISLSKGNFGFSIDKEEETLRYRDKEFSSRWSHLPYFIREAFHTSFTTTDPKKRPSAKEWKEKLQFYFNLLNGNLLNQIDHACLTIYDFKGEPFDYGFLLNVKMDTCDNVNHDNVKIVTPGKYIGTGFSMIDAVRKSIKAMDDKSCIAYLKDVRAYAELLKQKSVININKKITFKLLLNIGILKKVCLEVKSS